MTAQETQSSKKTTTVYVVQVKRTPDDGVDNWVDIGKVHMPPRARRRTVIEKALAGKALETTELYRVLDEASAKEYSVTSETQTTLVIG